MLIDKPVAPVNAPLAACNDAIKHFDKAIEADAIRIKQFLTQIRGIEASMKEMKTKRAQWVAARDRLMEVTDG